MKTKSKLMVLLSGLIVSGGLVHAQAPAPAANSVLNPTTSLAPVDNTSVTSPPNSYEKEVTPLLRQITAKKALLELKKLDREIEKLEEEALKAQAEREKDAAPLQNLNSTGPMGGQNPIMLKSGSGIPTGLPVGSGTDVDLTPNLKVLMVYGFNDNLFAKITFGSQGGYVIKKGDVTPDGKIVVDIKQNYIEVKEDKSKKNASTKKIFVIGTVSGKESADTTPTVPANPGGPASSAISAMLSSPLGTIPVGQNATGAK